MGKSKMDDAAAERIRRARGDKDGFSKRAADAARRNDGQDQHGSSSKSSSVGSKSDRESGGEKK
ncbi:predicted protein [Chaetomium globosum CBS 148.51]|uniref:Uncharacterized protein n=1 Tax=Chaetomium globosum (strain ATCC 6205 / CBS 148.51 / DSM 1962 / NBRC 6347 / NRRL 1970) TaxID=306901 RepID=Q2HH79_CHAGB|nr:uncharacterized protein CHGG_00425 [Chaetomium globosum CBS 148.51]EAQ92190.1 predicted protein [Chaetomium globosum CBS 148.51]